MKLIHVMSTKALAAEKVITSLIVESTQLSSSQYCTIFLNVFPRPKPNLGFHKGKAKLISSHIPTDDPMGSNTKLI